MITPQLMSVTIVLTAIVSASQPPASWISLPAKVVRRPQPLTIVPSVSAAPCTRNVLKRPPMDTLCTNYAATVTSTVSFDCGYCALSTRVLGVGLACQTFTDSPTTATHTEFACAAPYRARLRAETNAPLTPSPK
ncbi:hypothetical protein GQ43DRAFT_305556 [Delitschia confertaspora ATCC 74209]|uniref:Uncharacterized protein n=1 Tax=Delitschia confertaspora ATCC 74209 TaxID=1513339 RepID=A0A9P4JNM1_9PLEO|nr:hypothetical protein GQ43DRAFT_305556 [Delitschia confertaspora ATCC 74209]